MKPAPDLLDPSVSHPTVLAVLKQDCSRYGPVAFRLACGFRRILDDKVYAGNGSGRFQDFVRDNFDIEGKLAWTFALIGDHFKRLPAVREAMREGSLTYTKAREFVAIATPEDEAEWIRYAIEHTNRELERKVCQARSGCPQEPERAPVKIWLTGEQTQAFAKAQRKLAKEAGKPLPVDEVLTKMAEKVLDETRTDAKPTPALKNLATISFCPGCTDTWVPTHLGDMKATFEAWLHAFLEGETAVNLLGEMLCECEGKKHRRDCCPEREKIDPATWEGPLSRYIPSRVRAIIDARDGDRCRVPGCGNVVRLTYSHLYDFADGAPMEPPFVCKHCENHNKQIASGALVVEGLAPFERYYDKHGNYLGIGYDHEPRRYGKPLSHVENNGPRRAIPTDVLRRPPPDD